MAVATPPAALRPYVRRYVGWDEHMAAPLCRREPPSDEAPMVINLGAPIRLHHLIHTERFEEVDSFITGAYDSCQVVGSAGPFGGVQVDFTLLGLRHLLGRPLEDLTNRAVAPTDLFGPHAADLCDRLREAASWDARFAMVETFVMPRVLGESTVPGGVRCSWERLLASGGRVAIGDLVADTGWSQKHLIARFRHEIGLPPKVFARVLRFGRAVEAIRGGTARGLSDLAVQCGYYDQAHLTRDVRQFTQTTPGALVASLLPDGGGFRYDEAAAVGRRAG